MKVVICGDSYCAPSSKHRRHFGHLLHDIYGHDVINVAQGGVSMVAIGLQIESTLSLFPDAVIYKNTHADRFEVPIMGLGDDDQLSSVNLSRHRPGERCVYLVRRDVDVLGSSVHCRRRLVSDVLQNLLPDTASRYKDHRISEAQRQALKNYWIEIFDLGLKSLTDHWIHQYWTGQIQQHGALPVNLSADALGQELFEFSERNPNYPEPYHTDEKTQSLAAANIQQQLASWSGWSGKLDSDMLAWRESQWKLLANR